MKGAFCGSFDPVTLGHLDIIERAAAFCDELVVFISFNSNKNCQFSLQQRLDWLQQATAHLENVKCKVQTGLSVQACKEEAVDVLIRGIRNEADFAYEQNMAYMNHLLDEQMETVVLFTRPEYAYCSSSNVRELLRFGQDLSDFVPACVLETLKGSQK
jgi:pantetheine-phosphate adenylyltransferase